MNRHITHAIICGIKSMCKELSFTIKLITDGIFTFPHLLLPYDCNKCLKWLDYGRAMLRNFYNSQL